MMNLSELRLIKLAEVIYLTGISRSSIYLKMKNKEFPEPVKLGRRSVAWRSEDIQRFLESLRQNA